MQQRILTHVARYRLTFAEIVSVLYCGGSDAHELLDQLQTDGLLQTTSSEFPGDRRAYSLTRRGTSAVGVNARRAEAPNTGALLNHLAILSFCCLNRRPRILLEPGELASLVGGPPLKNTFFCLDAADPEPRLYRTYVPGSTTSPSRVFDTLLEHATKTLETPGLERWVHAGLCGHAILVETAARRRLIENAIEAREVELPEPVKARLIVEAVPTLTGLEEALRDLAERHQRG